MKQPKYRKIIEGAEALSLGISIVVAILIGVGLGLWMQSLFHQRWLLWLGVFWGVAAAILNIYKAYKKQKSELDELAKDPRYKNYYDKDEDEDLQEFEK
ncbi:ATP synthase protein I [Nitratiruptor sp. YY08-26]|uniref:AtpZ/AtpI family protein n=1 Tax=unclassified Nitratiruptor TaxID=2624044 RepID=UPI001916BDE8|nr:MULTISPECIES: AtpZ/AtpI family protein [unclassified Nitratiruptor]BCD62036.1 ATP synthase protein I [Nitratiruptor sp. YY08-13]BCD65972.1 ATP synthase protein I [Nitratiruptor sp. YY08-26]